MMKNLTFAVLISVSAVFAAQSSTRNSFSTPEEARTELLKAANQGIDALRALFGPGGAEIFRSGDVVQEKVYLQQFLESAAKKTRFEVNPMNPAHITLLVGEGDWPFAVPLMQKNGRWQWDVQEGKAEIRNRVIGQNELDAIQVCRGFVEAQQMYAETDWDGNGVLEYAQRIVSSPGKKDGLYWPGEDSPVAENFARAADQGYVRAMAGKGYHGYHFRVLFSQGPDAADGARDYVVHNLMIGGFALVAWPVEYGVSGIMTFLVNQDGIVYQKDLGSQTSSAVKTIKSFNPDRTWVIPPQ